MGGEIMGMRSIVELVRARYERLIAGLCVGGFLLALAYLALRLLSRPVEQEAFSRDIGGLKARFYQAKMVSEEVYQTARNSVTTPPQLATWTNRMFVPELRCWCDDCGRPIRYAAEVCPFCGKRQQKEPELPVVDTDKDGLPDEWEKATGLDPLDASDASSDADADGFSGLEEFKAGTLPRDAASAPPITEKLSLVWVRSQAFRLRFMGTSKLPDGDTLFQVNSERGRRSYLRKLGEPVEDLTISRFEPAIAGPGTNRVGRGAAVLILTNAQQTVTLPLRVPLLEERARLTLSGTGEIFDVRKGDDLTVMGKKYQVLDIDIKARAVVLQQEFNAVPLTVTRPAEETSLSR